MVRACGAHRVHVTTKGSDGGGRAVAEDLERRMLMSIAVTATTYPDVVHRIDLSWSAVPGGANYVLTRVDGSTSTVVYSAATHSFVDTTVTASVAAAGG